MLAIKNNLMAEQAARQLNSNYDALGKSVARLSSGKRIVTAKDDAAGMAVQELIRADVTVLRQGSRNAQDAISMLQTTEGALSVIDDILVRMKELAEQAATESYSTEQRTIMDEEFQQLISEIDRISNNTSFNSLKLLDEETETYNIHLASTELLGINTKDMTAAGLDLGGKKSTAVLGSAQQVNYITSKVSFANQVVTVSFGGAADSQTQFSVSLSSTAHSTLQTVVDAFNAQSRAVTGEEYDIASIYYNENTGNYGIKLTAMWGDSDNTISLSSSTGGLFATGNWDVTSGTAERLSIADPTQALGALNTISDAIEEKDSYRARMGYLMNRLESAVTVIDIQAENLLAAESRIADVDVATEMAALTRHQVLAQAGMSMLSQANSLPQMALSLLNG
jgi:flagellin